MSNNARYLLTITCLLVAQTVMLMSGCEVQAEYHRQPVVETAAHGIEVTTVDNFTKVVYDPKFHVACYVFGLRNGTSVNAECFHVPGH